MKTLQLSLILMMTTIVVVVLSDRVPVEQCVRSGTTYCVRSEQSENCTDPCCTPATCQTLMEYAEKRTLSTSNATFIFSPGEHLLHRKICIKYVSNLSLVGDATNDSVIKCNESTPNTGLYFRGVHNLILEHLNVLWCSYRSGSYWYAIKMENITHLQMNHVTISNTTGMGLRMDNLYGSSTIRNSLIQYSSGNITQNLAIYCYNDSYHNMSSVSNILISNSTFQHGYHTENVNKSSNDDGHRYASGVLVYIACNIRMIITFYKVNITNNTVHHYSAGGNMAIEYQSYNIFWPIQISLIDCRIVNGRSNIGGGLYFNAFRIPGGRYDNLKLGNEPQTKIGQGTTVPILTVNGTTFLENESQFGAGVYIRFRETQWPMVAKISFSHCQFERHQLYEDKSTQHGGVAIHVRNFQLPVYVKHYRPLLKMEFLNCNFTDNLPTQGLRYSSQYATEMHNGALYIQGIDSVKFSGCVIANNNCTGIVAIQSLLQLSGENIIHNNTGVRGGGMVLCSRSVIFLHNGTLLKITENTAKEFGGGIYVESECDQDTPHCFFQINSTKIPKKDTRVRLVNNTALAGKAIYGGMIDSCIIYMNITQSYIKNQASRIFGAIFSIEPNDTSVISSNPSSVCFCKNETFDSSCLENRTINRIIVPGFKCVVYVMLLGQKNSPSPGIVQASIVCNNNRTLCSVENKIQQTAQNPIKCARLEYTITSPKEDVNGTMELAVAGGSFEYSGKKNDYMAVVNLTIQKCPLGSKIDKSGKCLSLLDNTHTIISYILRRGNPPVWIGYTVPTHPPSDSAQIIYHEFCPLGYCKQSKYYHTKINTTYKFFDQDVQCAQYRTGLLCGECNYNYSLGFGSSQCLPGCDTTQEYLQYLRVIGLIAVCGVAGILLVVLLTLLNLTVAEGTLNGLIFYANIVQVNVDIFFPSDTRSRPWTAFIAWLNLDFGWTVCFYDGMDAYVKTWLQFIFPLYLWMLSGAIVYFSRKSRKIAKLAGKNAVKVLATLFLLSFGKLIRTVIAAGFYTNVKSHDGSINRSVWLLDPNIRYLHGKHIVLFVAASLSGVVAILYALTLTFIQRLRRSPNSRMCRWVQRLKPLLDAYTGPYKDRYHFWTGFLLLVRITLFTSFACNFNNDPTVNFTLIIIVCALLLIAIQPGIYRKSLIGFLESLMYINLILFSAIMMFMLGKFTKYRAVTANIFGVLILLKFLIIVAYYIYKEWIGAGSCRSRLRNVREGRVMIQPLVIQRTHNDSISDEEIENSKESSNNTWRSAADYREPLIVNGSL